MTIRISLFDLYSSITRDLSPETLCFISNGIWTIPPPERHRAFSFRNIEAHSSNYIVLQG